MRIASYFFGVTTGLLLSIAINVFPINVKLPEETTVDLSVIPYGSCGTWAENVERVLNSDTPTFALHMWAMIHPQDAKIIQLTYDYILASDIRDSKNFFGTANADCLNAERGTKGSI